MTALLSPSPPAVRRRVAVGLVIITGLSWSYLIFLGARMGDMQSPFAMPMTSAWTGREVALMWTMWAVMMAGMMLPSASPMISAYSTTVRSDTPGLHGSTGLFVIGYLAAWSGFAALATGAPWVLHDAALVSAMGVSTSTGLGGILLVAAGAYQFTGIKDACLSQCRSPVGFLLNEWRPGPGGAVVMGARHGAFCVGCCWALMALLFVLGVMNFWWIALVAAVVLLEKLVPSQALTRVLGGSLMVWGAALMTGLGS
jgi:predicted metal-binding membrane protein